MKVEYEHIGRWIFSLFVLALAVIGISAPTFAGADVFVADLHFDFGKVVSGKTVEHIFILKNSGSTALQIKNVTVSCGCTLVKLDDASIPPGSESALHVSVTTAKFSGPKHATVEVESNDEKTPKLLLTIDGVVTLPIKVIPDSVFFGKTDPYQSQSMTVDLTADGTPFKITNVELTDSRVKASLETVTPGQAYRMRIDLRPPLGDKKLDTQVLVSTDNADLPKITIPVSAVIMGELAFSPSEVVVDVLQKIPVTRYIIVSPGELKDFKVVSVKAPLDSIGVEIQEIGAAGYRIKLTNVVDDKALDGKTIQIKTTAPKMSEILIPIRVKDPKKIEATNSRPATRDQPLINHE